MICIRLSRGEVAAGGEVLPAVLGLQWVVDDQGLGAHERWVVVGLGTSEETLRAHALEQLKRGVVYQLGAVVRPGQDPAWDAAWRTPKQLLGDRLWSALRARSVAALRGRGPYPEAGSILCIEPLRAGTFAPATLDIFIDWALAQGPHTRGRPASWNVALEVAPDFSPDEYAALVDAVRHRVGPFLRLPGDRPPEQPSWLGRFVRYAGFLGPAALLLGLVVTVALRFQALGAALAVLGSAILGSGDVLLRRHRYRPLNVPRLEGPAP